MPDRPENGRLISAALILGVSSLVSRLVGLLRERVFTTVFGAGDVFDAFVAAFRIPDLVFNLVVIGALSASFIPLFTQRRVSAGRRGEGARLRPGSGVAGAFTFANTILNIVVPAVAALGALLALSAPFVVPLITPGFSGEKLHLTIQLTRIMALQPLFLAVSFVFSGMLNSFHRFVAYALAPIVYNVGIIVGVLALVPWLGVSGLGWGVVLGAGLHWLVQVPSTVRVGWRWRPELELKSAEVRTAWRMMIPRVVGLAGQQVNLLIVTVFGSALTAGSIAAFHLANNVQYLPIGIFGIAFAQAAFPTLAEHQARRDANAFRRTLTRTFRFIIFFVVPVSVLYLLLRAQLIRVFFGAGAFDWEDTIMTFNTLAWLAVSLFAQATVPLLTRAFYVQRDSRTPVLIALGSMAVNLLGAIILAPRFGVLGLAAAFSVAAIVNMALLLGVLHQRLGGFDDRAVIVSLGRVAFAALVGGLATQLLKYPVAHLVDMQRFWGVAVQLVVAAGGGIAVYVALCWLMHVEEIEAIRRYLPRRLRLAAGTETPRFEGMTD